VADETSANLAPDPADDLVASPAGDDTGPVLTDEEIDALVEASDDRFGGAYDDGEFKSHDFGAGEALNLSRWTELDVLIRNHAELLAKVFQHSFGFDVEIEPFAPMYSDVGELLTSMPERVCIVSTEIAPLRGESHLVLTGTMLDFLVNQFFGGGAVAAPQLKNKVTPSEQRIGERVAKDFLRAMAEVWAERLPLTLGDLYVDITPERLELQSKSVGYVTLTFLMTVGHDHRSEFRLLLPYVGLEVNETALMPVKQSAPQTRDHTEWQDRLAGNLPSVSVDIAVVVDEVNVTIRDLLALHVGQVIPIKEPKHVRLLVEGQLIAHGTYGEHNGNVALQFDYYEGSNS
jgi:flagellar motor switch protein FliM